MELRISPAGSRACPTIDAYLAKLSAERLAKLENAVHA